MKPALAESAKTSPKQDHNIVAAVSKKRKVSSRKIATDLQSKNIFVSPRTVRRRLNEAGYKYLPPMTKPLLTDKARENRLKWANENKDRNWNNVIFTDETTFELFRPPVKVWRAKGEKVVMPKVKHPLKVHAWGCFSNKGFGEIFLFSTNLNADLLCKIYKDTLLPSAQKMFGEEKQHWLLQEDNDPKHKSKAAQKWRDEFKVEKVNWPSYSPDQNPIENVWALMKSQVAQMKIFTLKGLKMAIQSKWSNFSVELAQRLVASIPHRIEQLIQQEGDYTMYS